jgi:hypothetical protein
MMCSDGLIGGMGNNGARKVNSPNHHGIRLSVESRSGKTVISTLYR